MRVAIVLLVVSVVLAAVASVVTHSIVERERTAFMEECQADGNKWYVCKALWRQMNPPLFGNPPPIAAVPLG